MFTMFFFVHIIIPMVISVLFLISYIRPSRIKSVLEIEDILDLTDLPLAIYGRTKTLITFLFFQIAFIVFMYYTIMVTYHDWFNYIGSLIAALTMIQTIDVVRYMFTRKRQSVLDWCRNRWIVTAQYFVELAYILMFIYIFINDLLLYD